MAILIHEGEKAMKVLVIGATGRLGSEVVKELLSAGSGRTCQEAGLEPPRLEEIGTDFRVTISSERIRKPNTDETDQRIIALLGDGVPRSTAVVAKHVGLSQRATLTRLKSMTSRGLLVEIGTGPHDPKRQYALA